MKSFLKIVKVLSFFVIFAFLFYQLQIILRPKDHSLYTMNEFYHQPTESIDIILCGSSHVVFGADANVITDLTGLNTFSIAINGQKLSYTYEYVKEALKTQSPKIIVVDAFHFARQNQEMPIVDLHYSSDSLRWTWNKVSAITRFSSYEYWKELFFPIIRYHSRWNCLKREDLAYCLKRGTEDHGNRGFRALDKTTEQERTIWNDAKSVPLSRESAMYLEQLAELSHQYNFKLVFLNLPFAELTPERIASYNELYSQLNEMGIKYLDYNYNEFQIIDYKTDFSDSGHLNWLGAEKISTDFSDRISQMLKD